jgi:Xaa-Pro dipeptidase
MDLAEHRTSAAVSRLQRLRETLSEDGVEFAVLYGTGRHGFLTPNPCWYFSGVKQIGRDACLVVPVDGDPVLIVTPLWDAERCQQAGWIDEVIGADSLGETLGRLARDRRWGSRRTVLAGLAFATGAVAASLRAPFDDPIESVDLFDRVARTHDAYAVALLERAVAIGEAGYNRARELVRPGMLDYELVAECEMEIRALGADDNFLIMGASQHNLSVRAPTGRRLCEGDVVLAEISPAAHGQFAQICRSFVLGEPTETQAREYGVLVEAFNAGLDACTPGTPVSDVAEAVNEVTASYGYGAYNVPPYMRSRGHAQALGALFPADVSDRSTVVLEEGMGFVLHPNQYFPESGYFLCGDEVLIEAGGARVLAREQATLDSVAFEVVA